MIGSILQCSDNSSNVSLTNVLNRHEVLHGESVDYGTEINSLKAISLLYYIASVLGERGHNEA